MAVVELGQEGTYVNLFADQVVLSHPRCHIVSYFFGSTIAEEVIEVSIILLLSTCGFVLVLTVMLQ